MTTESLYSSNKLFTFILMLVVLLMVVVKLKIASATKDGNSPIGYSPANIKIEYIRDSRTGFCFAYNKITSVGTGPVLLTLVPCWGARQAIQEVTPKE